MKRKKLPKGLRRQLERVGSTAVRRGKKRHVVVLTAGAGVLAYLLKRRNRTDDAVDVEPVYSPIRLGQGELDPQRAAQYYGLVTEFTDNSPEYRLRIDTGTKFIDVTITSNRQPNCGELELKGAYVLVFTDGSKPEKDKPIEALEIQLLRR